MLPIKLRLLIRRTTNEIEKGYTYNKKSPAHFFLATYFLLIPQLLFAQPVNKPYYNFKTFTTADGISSNEVRCTYKDSRGFLWIGTNRGLQRYNGSTFLTFRHSHTDSNSICNEVINSITEDKQHNIWIATMNGVMRFNYSNGKLTNYIYVKKNEITMPFGEVFVFFEDSKGRQWIGTAGAGLYFFDKIKRQFVPFSPAAYLGLKENYFDWVQSIRETIKQELVFTVRNGLLIINKEGKQQYIPVPVPPGKVSISLACYMLPFLNDHPDEIWIGAWFSGIYKYEMELKKWTHYTWDEQLHSNPSDAVVTWNKDEWLLGNDQLCFFNHRTGVYRNAFDDKMGAIKNIYRDNEGSIWISTLTKGLIRVNTSAQLFSSTQYISGWPQDRLLYYSNDQQILYSINPYFANSIIYFHTATNAISRDTIAWFAKHQKVINKFIADSNILYMAIHGGMWKYNLLTHHLDSIVYKNTYVNSQRSSFYDVCKSNKKIYFAGNKGSGGPYMYDKATHIVTDLAFLSTKNITNKHHSYSVAFSNNILYTGMIGADRIYCFDETNNKKFFISIPANYDNGEPASIASLCIDKKQNLWCGTTENGIYVFSTSSKKWVRHISAPDGYFASTSAQLICDDDNTVWCNSSEGLFAFNTTNFRFKNYTLKDGLYNENESGFLALLPNHELAYNNIVGDNTSFGIITTKRVDTIKQTVPISITNLQVLGKVVFTDTLLDNMDKLILSPNHNTFSLSYAGVTITEAKNLLYSYLLEGVEKTWHNVGNNQTLSYLNLNPGKYTLHIKCRSLDEQITGKERLLNIILLPAWYQTWWFKLFSILGLSGLLFFSIRYYYIQQINKQKNITEKERALTEERNRIAADMHDDVGAGLSRIRYITSAMQLNHQANDTDINKIVSLSDEAVEKMNEIIWSLNQGNQQLAELIYYTRSQCSEMVNNAGIKFTFNLPENIPAKTIGWKDCRNIYLLIKEAVNNAIKHSDATSISIECSVANQLTFSIADNGNGFDPGAVRKEGNGLGNFQKRIAVLKGSHEIKTGNGNGTYVLLSIPLINL